MSLKSQPEYTAAQSAAFEPMEDETATQTMTETQTATKEQTMNTTTINDAAVTATTAIATAAASSALAVGGANAKFQLAFVEKFNVFDTPTVEALAMAAPRLTGEQGSFFKKGEEIGSKIHVEIVSYNNRWVVGTGESDREAKDFFKVSFDNQTISGSGEDFHAYLESLKAQGFQKARISPYLDVFCFVVWTDKKGDIPVDERELCILQCSQTSKGNFMTFCTTRGLLESKGVAKPIEVVEVSAQKQQNGKGDKYTNYLFSVPRA